MLAATDTILALEADNLQALEHRKNAFVALGRAEEATAADIAYLLTAAHQDLQANDFQNLLASSNEILAIDSTHLAALDLKKTALQGLEQPQAAQAVEITSLLIVADSLARKNDHAALLKIATQLLSIDPLHERAVEMKRDAHTALGQTQLAQRTSIDYWLGLAATRMRQKNYQEVHTLVDKILGIDPDHLEALTLKRNAFLSTARLAEAMAIKKQIELLQQEK